MLGANSSYSASMDDGVYLKAGDEDPRMDGSRESLNDLPAQNTAGDRSVELIIELQVKYLFCTLSNFLHTQSQIPLFDPKIWIGP